VYFGETESTLDREGVEDATLVEFVDSVVQGKGFDLVLLESAALGLYQRGDVGLEDAVLTFYRPDFDLQAIRVDLAAISCQEKISDLCEIPQNNLVVGAGLNEPTVRSESL
jgi:hypothetical protein